MIFATDREVVKMLMSFTIILFFVVVYAQDEAKVFVRTGRYNPQIFGESGRYTPDNRGKYKHIPVPYNGGYGDRGLKYFHDEDYRLRYWQQNGEYGTWEVPDTYEDTAPYASGKYDPSSSIPNYIDNGDLSYAHQYDYENDGWRIIEFQWSKDGKTRYSYLYETENKILAQEVRKLARLNENTSANRVDGYYQYEGDDGTIYEVDYVANENGLYSKKKDIHQSIQNVLDFLLKNKTKIRGLQN